MLASKKQINQLISWNWKLDAQERKDSSKPDLLNSWRYELVKDTLKSGITKNLALSNCSELRAIKFVAFITYLQPL